MKLLENVPLIKQLEIINRLNFFADFSLAERQVLLESFSRLYLVNSGRHAFKRFELDNRLFIVLSGEFVIFKSNELQELGRILPGEFIGEGAFICHREHSTSAKAIKDSILLAITPDAMTRLPNVIREKVKDKIIEGMSLRINKLSSFIEDSI
ncbi:cyclic nucleotide-binding domain-containing protein [Pseudoalteromonas sp. S16_S37]|uniref:cyclic nucleotide-binding domain-containing protein n=1 Tax=Pseudoalteromonas sp. S16_S37 TaxID=2720228 RepID=UPI0016808259|nr:cyclic nucleotide-binding domain-containing protein [Pseudoalteromonas sp. S16_S37]MBD1582387.1 cyclic nucleotide-binding domain-containing protein [Pseudoalteromonas sp. S16_S37]